MLTKLPCLTKKRLLDHAVRLRLLFPVSGKLSLIVVRTFNLFIYQLKTSFRHSQHFLQGNPYAEVDSSILTFVNHGCNGKYNIGEATEFDESTADATLIPDAVLGKKEAKFNPLVDRHFLHSPVQALKHIPVGAEILDNYVSFTADQDFWSSDIVSLRDQCAGAAGDVVNIERGAKSGAADSRI